MLGMSHERLNEVFYEYTNAGMWFVYHAIIVIFLHEAEITVDE
jgi:hypothetical protein